MMSPELDKKLCEKYPKIFVNRHGNMKETAMCWGFECGDGWYDLLDHLCADLQWNTDKNNSHGRYPQVVASQVKEKFGGLRFYVESSNDAQDAVISFVEYLSTHTCEVCGKPGKIREGGWLRTLCDEHANT